MRIPGDEVSNIPTFLLRSAAWVSSDSRPGITLSSRFQTAHMAGNKSDLVLLPPETRSLTDFWISAAPETLQVT
jgi:hypothetical protein